MGLAPRFFRAATGSSGGRIPGGGGNPQLVFNAPWRDISPRLQGIDSPGRGLVRMAPVARVGNLEGIRRGRRNKFERVTPDVHIGNRLLDFRHVATDAFIARGASLMMSMRFNACPTRTVG